MSKHCHALSDESIHLATILGSWPMLPGLVSENEIIIAIRKYSKHSKPTGITNIYKDNSDSE